MKQDRKLRVVIWSAVSKPSQSAPDKVSLEEQERAGRAWAAEHNADVVAVLTIPGESRSDADVISVFEEFAEKGIFAYHNLRTMWQQPRQFDVLWCYHETRLARVDALFAYVISNVARSGARIYSHLGGWYEPNDYKFKMAVGMIGVSSDMERFVAMTKASKLAKAEKGTLVHGRVAWWQIIIRNERGEAIGKAGDESKRVYIEAAARLLLEGVGWNSIEIELHKRFGLVNPATGKIFNRHFFYFVFHNPNFWGHEVINGALSGVIRTRDTGETRFDLWIFDPTYPAPEDTKIFYNVMPPYFDPEFGALVMSELRRRKLLIKGTARPQNTHRFRGLICCYYCGRILTFVSASQPRKPWYVCRSRVQINRDDRCLIYRYISEQQLTAWFDEQLRLMLAEQNFEFFIQRESGTTETQIQQLETRIAQLEAQINRAIDEQLLTTDDSIRARYRERIIAWQAELETARNNKNVLKSRMLNNTRDVESAYKRLREFESLERFWQAEDRVINQVLHGLMRGKVLIVRDQEIIGVADRPSRV